MLTFSSTHNFNDLDISRSLLITYMPRDSTFCSPALWWGYWDALTNFQLNYFWIYSKEILNIEFWLNSEYWTILHPQNKSHLNMVNKCIPEYWLLIFCWRLLYVYLSGILDCSFLFFCGVWFWYNDNVALIDCIWNLSILFDFLE